MGEVNTGNVFSQLANNNAPDNFWRVVSYQLCKSTHGALNTACAALISPVPTETSGRGSVVDSIRSRTA